MYNHAGFIKSFDDAIDTNNEVIDLGNDTVLYVSRSSDYMTPDERRLYDKSIVRAYDNHEFGFISITCELYQKGYLLGVAYEGMIADTDKDEIKRVIVDQVAGIKEQFMLHKAERIAELQEQIDTLKVLVLE